jgi:hypothetical protein
MLKESFPFRHWPQIFQTFFPMPRFSDISTLTPVIMALPTSLTATDPNSTTNAAYPENMHTSGYGGSAALTDGPDEDEEYDEEELTLTDDDDDDDLTDDEEELTLEEDEEDDV